MRHAIALTLLALAASVLAPAASAQVEIVNEANAQHCPGVTIAGHTPGGGCEVNVQTVTGGHAEIEVHVHGTGEIVTSECQNTFDARIQESGHGFIYNQNLTHEAPDNLCVIEVCEELDDARRPWPFHMHEFANVKWAGVTFCLKTIDSEDGNEALERPCTVAVPLVDTTGSHNYVASTIDPGSETENPQDSASRCSEAAVASLSGTWTVLTTMTDIEIEHEGQED